MHHFLTFNALNMKKYFLIILLLFVFCDLIKSQNMYKPSLYEIKTLPLWAQKMYEDSLDIKLVDKLYKAYYEKNSFVKTYHTQYYKQLKRALLSKNKVEKPDLNQSRLNQAQTKWSNLGVVQSHKQGGGASNDQANIYAVTQCSINSSIMYLGTETGQVYKSNNTGISWTCVSMYDEFPGGVTAIAVNPINPNEVYAGCNSNLMKSINGGSSWTAVISNVPNLNINEILIDRSNPQLVLVATDKGLYRSINGGGVFTQLFNNTKCYDVKQNTASANSMYLVKNNPAQNLFEFYRSMDAGATWTIQTNGWHFSNNPARYDGGARIGVTPANPNKIYVHLIGESKAGDNGFIGVYRSADGGQTWTLPNAPAGGPYSNTHLNLAIAGGTSGHHQGFYNCAIMVSATDENKVLVGGTSLWRSIDGAVSFSAAAGYNNGNLNMHVDMQDFRAFGNGKYWITTDGGVYFSSDFFTTLAIHKNTGIHAQDFWGFGSGWNNDVLVGGLYHNGNLAYYENYGVGNYLELGGGESPTGYVNPGNNLKTCFSDVGGKIIPTSLTGSVQSFPVSKFPNEMYYPAESSEMEHHPSFYNTAFIGKENKLWKTLDGGTTYTLINAFGTATSNPVYQIEISRSNPNIMYVAQTNPGQSISNLWKTTNGGSTWNSVTQPIANNNGNVLLQLDYNNANNLWIAYPYGANGTKVYKTTTGGVTWQNLTTSTLNNQEAHSILLVNKTNGGLYFCSNNTVFYRNNSMADWDLANDSLPTYFNSNIAKPFYRDSKIRIASYGKGIWENKFYDTPTGPSAKAMVDKEILLKSFCASDSLYFDDYSALNHNGASWSWSFQGGSPSISNSRNPAVSYTASGTYKAKLTVTDAALNTSSDSIYVTISIPTLPTQISENFQTVFPNAPYFKIVNPNGCQWVQNDSVGGYGASTKSTMFDNFYCYGTGDKDDLIAYVDFSNPSQTKLTFDVAYAMYSNVNSDTLQVLVSNNCGTTYTTVYTKGGSVLSTSSPQTSFFEPTSSQWRTDTVDLLPYSGSQNLMIVFRNIGRYGNVLYLDNINLPSTPIIVTDVNTAINAANNKIELYPNPAEKSGSIMFKNLPNQKFKATIYDAKGSLIVKNLAIENNVLQLSNTALNPGVYLICLEGETVMYNKKIIIK